MQLDQYISLGQVVSHHAIRRPSALAVVYNGVETNFKMLNRRSEQVAAKLREMGIPRGAHIGLLAKNSDAFIECFFGIAKAGAIITPLNWRLAGDELEFIIRDAEIGILFCESEFASVIPDEIRNGLKLIYFDVGNAPCYEDWIKTAPSEIFTSLDSGMDDTVLQVYTSGTTGRPKGVMLTNANFTKFCNLDTDEMPIWWRVTSEDISLLALPTFHIGGLECVLRSIFAGGTLILQRDFNPLMVLQGIGKYRPTSLSLVPTALQLVLRQPGADTMDFSCIRNFYYGASPIPAELLREALAVMRCSFVQCYGMTETTSSIVSLGPDDHHPDGTPQMLSAGKALPNTEIKIIDTNGVNVPTGVVGEVMLRGHTVMKGYWKRDEATAQTIEPDGWLHTGDAGYLDSEGYLYIHDRIKDMIVSGGENIYPAEVESAIFGHPQVAEVAVIGVPDQVWGESVKALIVLKPGAVFDETKIFEWARKRIAAYKLPKTIDVVQALPKNPAGKVLKVELRKPYWSNLKRGVN